MSIDPDLAQRVTMVDRGGDATIQLASQLTAAGMVAPPGRCGHRVGGLPPPHIDLLGAGQRW